MWDYEKTARELRQDTCVRWAKYAEAKSWVAPWDDAPELVHMVSSVIKEMPASWVPTDAEMLAAYKRLMFFAMDGPFSDEWAVTELYRVDSVVINALGDLGIGRPYAKPLRVFDVCELGLYAEADMLLRAHAVYGASVRSAWVDPDSPSLEQFFQKGRLASPGTDDWGRSKPLG
jgi:hypothetical protein